jgi:flagellar biosynthetic protein FliQ
MFLVMVFAGPWMLTLMTDYMRSLFMNLPAVVG